MVTARIKHLLRHILPATMIRSLVRFSQTVRRLGTLVRRARGIERETLLRHQTTLPTLPYPRELKDIEMQVYSQHGEDGLTLYFLSQIPTQNRFVEIGVEDGRECNTGVLSLYFGWQGLLIEGDPRMAESARRWYAKRVNGRVQVLPQYAKPDTINALLSATGYADKVDLLSIDVDGIDYWLWDSLQCVKPSVVIMEFNHHFGDDLSMTVPNEPEFNRFKKHFTGYYFGASLTALYRLAARKGYDLIGCDSSGTNAYFMRTELRSKTKLEALTPKQAFPQHRADKTKVSPQEFLKLVHDLPLITIHDKTA